MVTQPSTPDDPWPPSRDAQVLNRLVGARIFGRYAFFFVTGEGEFFKNGVERASGLVLERDGKVWSFWTGWDDTRNEVTLAEWKPVTPEPAWREADEYREARRALDLPL